MSGTRSTIARICAIEDLRIHGNWSFKRELVKSAQFERASET
jgi:hypothetical protein